VLWVPEVVSTRLEPFQLDRPPPLWFLHLCNP
jgi:hypothetical protein